MQVASGHVPLNRVITRQSNSLVWLGPAPSADG